MGLIKKYTQIGDSAVPDSTLYLLKRSENMPSQDLYVNVHSSIIHGSPHQKEKRKTLEIIQMSING